MRRTRTGNVLISISDEGCEYVFNKKVTTMKKVHHDIEFMVLRKRLKHARGIDEKISLLEQLVALNPRDPKNLTLRRKYRESIETLRLKRGTGKQSAKSLYDAIHYKRQMLLVGETNTGKSTLLNKLTGSFTPIKESPFTTYHPEVQMMNFRDVSIQVIEVPAVYAGDSDTAKYRFIRNADVLCVCARTEEDFDLTVRQLENYFIKLGDSLSSTGRTHQYKLNDEVIEKPAFVASWKTDIEGICLAVVDINDIESISKRIYSLLNIKRIFSVKHGEIQGKPLVFSADQEVTVFDFIKSLDKRILTSFKRAKIIHSETTIHGEQIVGLDFKLGDGDMVELVLS